MARNKYGVQELRQSQFVLMYGPGSIIEGEKGSRLIPNLKTGLGNRFKDEFLEENKVADFRMKSIVGKLDDNSDNNIKLVSIPSNASLNTSSFKGIYSTTVFPAWQICHNSENHPDGHSVLYHGGFSRGKCPVCGKRENPNVRFVCACPDGHLDEVDWNYAVHKNEDNSCNYNCNPRYYNWIIKEGSSSLSNIVIECPDCHKKTNMNKVYQTNFACTGRLPEHDPFKFRNSIVGFSEANRPRNCKRMMKVVQKQSTSLRLPNTITLLKIPKYDKPIYEILSGADKIQNAIKRTTDEYDFLDMLKEFNVVDSVGLKVIKEYILANGYPNFLKMVDNIEKCDAELSSALDEEFKTLFSEPDTSDNFSKSEFVNYDLIVPDSFSFPLKVCPIDKITTVTAQFSYQRKPYVKENEDYKTVSSSYMVFDTNKKDFWYPAFEGVGEGIFITSDYNPLENDYFKESTDIWNNNMPDFNEKVITDDIKSPLFVWWHTLSHAIIKSLAVYCGYSSSSLHERVYINKEQNLGGILIYNTSPGDDSGMGGLVDTVKIFDVVLKNAVNNLLFCSNDPLCYYEKLEDGGVNGAACHNCLLISETSCGYQNALLDRHFFV